MPASRHCASSIAVLFVFLLFLPIQAEQPPALLTAELLNYEELVQLYEQDRPPEQLQIKLQELLTTPFVSNEATAGNTGPLKPTAAIGRYIRVAHWNIGRGVEYEALQSALSDPATFASLLDPAKYPDGSPKKALVLEQAALLREADIVVLNEVDWGMKRSRYRNIVADLAVALKMNYAFGTEFIEVDPIALGREKFEGVDDEERMALTAQVAVDSSLYKGLHGSAILSRFPLTNVRLIPFRAQGHDWYGAEKKGVSKIEQGKRAVSKIAFKEKIEREIRRGGRTMLLADVEDPDIPEGRLTIVATHLESRTKPANRVKQLEELLSTIKEIRNPVIMAGDMNTSSRDSTPTSISREIKQRLGSKKFWLQQGIKALTGLGFPNTFILDGLNEYRKQADPTVRSVSLVASNPEAKFFEVLKKFRFSDGRAFDFRGDRDKSIGSHSSPLANSNQRGKKGFITTYEFEHTISFVGKFKLDWIFVKPPALTSPYGERQSYIFAPHFGRTLKELNESIEDRISDHAPLIVDLPLGEPGNGSTLAKLNTSWPQTDLSLGYRSVLEGNALADFMGL